MSPETLQRVRAALRDAEMWTAKYIADNHERAEPGMPLEAATRALSRITATYTEIGRASQSTDAALTQPTGSADLEGGE